MPCATKSYSNDVIITGANHNLWTYPTEWRLKSQEPNFTGTMQIIHAKKLFVFFVLYFCIHQNLLTFLWTKNKYSNGFGDTGQNDIVSVVGKMDSKTWTTVDRPNYIHKNFNADVHLFLKMGKTATSYLSLSAALFCFSLMISASLERKNKQHPQLNLSTWFRSIAIVHVALNSPISDIWRSQKA